MASRQYFALGDVADLVRGVSYRPADLQERDSASLPLLRATNIRDHALELADVLYVPPALVREHQLLRRFDVVIAMSSGSRAAVGRLAQLRQEWTGCVGAFCGVIRANPQRVHPEYLGYVLQSPDFRTRVETYAVGTAIMNLSRERILGYSLVLPDVTEQRAIAHILGTLDDKIELNRRMAATLEEMARAIFKSWFIDFDPVRAKAEGRPTHLPPEIDALFPDSFENSALGNIPSGWEVTMLADVLAELEVGSRPKGGVGAYTSGIPSIGAESIVGLGIFDYTKTKYVPLEFFERMTRGQIMSRDVLLYKDGGRPGEFEPHVTMFGDGFPFETAAINEHVYRLRAKPHLGQEFLFFWLSSPLIMEEMRVKGTGVAIPGLNSTQVRSLTTLVPAPAVIDAFARYVEPCVARLLAACKDSRTLATIRDALLPKLISGALHVPQLPQ